jgi:hypothetical protein
MLRPKHHDVKPGGDGREARGCSLPAPRHAQPVDTSMSRCRGVGPLTVARAGTGPGRPRQESQNPSRYDRESQIDGLDKALDLAPTSGWVVVSLKDDWKNILGGAE